MKRSITRWTVTLAAAGVLGLPVSSFARTQDPTPQQPQPTPSPTASTAPSSANQATTPQEHLQQAQAAVSSIDATSVPAKNRASIADLKKHLSNLEKLGSSPSASPTETAKPDASKTNWGTEVAAIDKIISEMVASESPSTPSTPTPTGTSGTTAKSSTMIDEATRAKLMDVRTHITAYAAGMAGTSTPKTEASASPDTTAATAAHPESSMTSSTPSASPSSTTSSSPNPAATPSQPPQSTPSQSTPPQNPPTTQPDPNAGAQQPPTTAQPPAAGAAQQPTAGAAQVDTDAAHRHLVTARDALSQMTQLPAAGQLNGEARTQVAQLITNFNELIGNPADWHVSYQKVAANLSTLLGPDNSDAEATAGAPTAATGATPAPGAPAPGAAPTPGATTPGAVGTAGTGATVELDPTIRAKLVEFRKSLNDFQKAAGGAK